MEKYIEALKGISYSEWIKLQIAINRKFEMQRKELEKGLQLQNENNEIEKIIQSQFG